MGPNESVVEKFNDAMATIKFQLKKGAVSGSGRGKSEHDAGGTEAECHLGHQLLGLTAEEKLE